MSPPPSSSQERFAEARDRAEAAEEELAAERRRAAGLVPRAELERAQSDAALYAQQARPCPRFPTSPRPP